MHLLKQFALVNALRSLLMALNVMVQLRSRLKIAKIPVSMLHMVLSACSIDFAYLIQKSCRMGSAKTHLTTSLALLALMTSRKSLKIFMKEN